MEILVRTTLELEQYKCLNCDRLFYMNKMDKVTFLPNNDPCCPYGCLKNGKGNHVRTIKTEVKEVYIFETADLDLTGKYVIMETNEEDVITNVFFCESGFGCKPDAIGTKIYGYFVADHEECYMPRHDVLRLATDHEVKQAQERFMKDNPDIYVKQLKKPDDIIEVHITLENMFGG